MNFKYIHHTATLRFAVAIEVDISESTQKPVPAAPAPPVLSLIPTSCWSKILLKTLLNMSQSNRAERGFKPGWLLPRVQAKREKQTPCVSWLHIVLNLVQYPAGLPFYPPTGLKLTIQTRNVNFADVEMFHRTPAV